MAEFPPPQAPQQAMPQAPGTQAPSMRDQLSPLVQSPMDDFLNELVSIADDTGVLEEAMSGTASVEDEADALDIGADPLEFLSEQQLTTLVQKFMAIPPEEQGPLVEQLRQTLPPEMVKRMEAIIRFVQGRSAQVGVTR